MHRSTRKEKAFLSSLEDREGFVLIDHDVEDLVALSMHQLVVSCYDAGQTLGDGASFTHLVDDLCYLLLLGRVTKVALV